MKYNKADKMYPKIDRQNGGVKIWNGDQYIKSKLVLYTGIVFMMKFFLFEQKIKQTKTK